MTSGLCHDLKEYNKLFGYPGSYDWEQSYKDTSGFGADYMKKSGSNGLYDFGSTCTYGEILSEGIREVILRNMDYKFTKDDIMYDLGSGTGKIVTQFAYESKCGNCIGIELGERRSTVASEVLRDLRENIDNIKYTNKMEFITGDILKEDWSKATVVFANAVCFPKELWTSIEKLLEDNSPNLRLVFVTGHQFQYSEEYVESLKKNGKIILKSTLSLPASWDKEFETVHCYRIEDIN